MRNIVLFLSFTSAMVLARLPQPLANAPSRLLSETHKKSVISSWIADNCTVIVLVLGFALFVALSVIFKMCCCQKTRPPKRIDEESNPGLWDCPGLWVTYGVRDLIVATNNFSDSNVVGVGGFARVYRADLGGNRIRAVKRLREVDPTLFGQELSILLRVPRHPNLVNLLGICSDPGYHVIVFEYVANGTLFSRLHENQGVAGPLSWASRKKIARQVAKALRHLHEEPNPPIIHRDVKSKNVLLENDFSAKLADFGIAKLGPQNNGSTGTTPRGTFGYMDPQCVIEHRCSVKSDVYSFGVLLLELITGSKALIGTEALVIRTRTDRLSTDTNNVMRIVDQSLPDRNNRNELLEMIRIANRCLQSERGDRPSMAEVVNLMRGIGHANAL